MSDLEDIYDESLTVDVDEETEFSFATISAVAADGVTLIFDGSDVSGGKKYNVNADVMFAAGDRVKIAKDSGSYVVEYVVGSPMSKYPIPSGGTAGQVLKKSSGDNYALEWGNIDGTLPTGGSSGQFLKKSSSTDFACEWVSIGTLPKSGTSGQFLKKSSATDYACEWASVGTLPTGGTAGQFLKKTNANNYACEWSSDVSVTKIGSTLYYVEMSNTSFVPSSNMITLGSSSYQFGGCYIKGSLHLGDMSSQIGFFGTTPQSRKTLYSSATLADVISGLKGYGLFS